MMTALTFLQSLRRDDSGKIDRENSNPYRLVFYESDGSRTAYCFAVPIYTPSGNLVNLEFQQQDSSISLTGSNATVTLQNEILLKNPEGSCRISLPGAPIATSARCISYQGLKIMPTFNGVLCRARCAPGVPFTFQLKPAQKFHQVKENGKYFALMREKFKPFVTVSAVGSTDEAGHILAPCTVSYQKESDLAFAIHIAPQSPYVKEVWYEINLHAPKLLQDTTVESKNPKNNNAFGGTAFIGNTALFGEQWLYTKIDLQHLPEFLGCAIQRTVLHLPALRSHNAGITAFRVAQRFCSFGSSWENKIGSAEALGHTTETEDYQSLDITALITDTKTKTLRPSNGLILKPKNKDSGFAAISTGDNFFSPQILEINFEQ